MRLRKWIAFASLFEAFAFTCAWGISLLKQPLVINLDTACILHFGRAMRDGAVPYVDFYDLNPPLTLYLHLWPAMVANFLNLHAIVTFKILLVCLTFLSIGLSALVLRRTFASAQCVYAAGILLCESLFGFISAAEFGQREHMFALLFMPFFLVRWRRAEGEQPSVFLALLCGVLAGVGLCIKFYFLLIPLFLELYWLLERKRFDNLLKTEMFACAASFVLCALQTALLPAASKKMFYEFIVPHTVSGYAGFNADIWRAVLMKDYQDIPLLSILLCCYLIFIRKSSRLFIPYALWILAGYLIFVIQAKCWPYHILPLVFGICLSGAGVVLALALKNARTLLSKSAKPPQADALDERSEYFVSLALLAVTSVLCLFTVVGQVKNLPAVVDALSIREHEPASTANSGLTRAIDKLSASDETVALIKKYSLPGEGVLFINTGISPGYPATCQLSRPVGSRYAHLQVIAFIEYEKAHSTTNEHTAALQKDEDAVLEAVATDVEKFKPRLIFIKQTIYQGCPPGFSLDNCLQRNGRLEQILKGYELVDSNLNLKTYRRSGV